MNGIENKRTWLGWVGLIVGGILWFAHTFHLPFFVMMFLGIGTSHIAMGGHMKIAGLTITVMSLAWLIYAFFFKKTCCKNNKSV